MAWRHMVFSMPGSRIAYQTPNLAESIKLKADISDEGIIVRDQLTVFTMLIALCDLGHSERSDPGWPGERSRRILKYRTNIE
ncbi:MAG: hypothetical protein GQ561_05205 [Calditrichae bacterium]|nr:hypothetical protein [Calditrichia bacterium]